MAIDCRPFSTPLFRKKPSSLYKHRGMGSEWWDGNRRRVARDVVTGILGQVNTRRHGCKAGKIARIFGCQRWCVQLSPQGNRGCSRLTVSGEVWLSWRGSVKHWNPTITGLIHTGKIQFVAHILKLECLRCHLQIYQTALCCICTSEPEPDWLSW